MQECVACTRNRKFVQNYSEMPKYEVEVNIKVYVKEITHGCVSWIRVVLSSKFVFLFMIFQIL